MLEFIPFELFYSIVHELDEQALRNLERVSRYYNILTSDNGVWSQKALKRWENKKGMSKVCDENRKFWFESPGAWKRVYKFVEKEATRTSLDVNDLVENIWFCTPIDNPWAKDTSITFYRDGTYIHHHEFFNASFSWSIAEDGSIRLNQKLFKLTRCSNWNLKISSGNLVFKSSGAESFKRKLREADLIPRNDN
ncbi:7675_t:CDS:2 [Dentiscutata erythropus]|uniref:7675_t:CDS:1 n=1 Tax=Dentiscutata erythropus TaxID=1348616 RepID=A0A9N9FKR8_9GLOM|nr:7675_t:CDS:2 [Dentiscutata erythropus]